MKTLSRAALSFFGAIKISSASDLALWYQHPAANWGSALPIGNTRLGAVVFGGVARELEIKKSASVQLDGSLK